MKYKTIIFDLDGTLLNTITDIRKSINESLNVNGFNAYYSIDDVKKFIGNGAKMLIKRACEPFKMPLEKENKVFDTYMDLYPKHLTDLTVPFEGTISFLSYLKNNGFIIGVISNKPERDTIKCVNHFFKDTFDFIIGGKKELPKKPDPSIFDVVLEHFMVHKETTLYIGDMMVDIEFAKNVGIDVAIYSKGYGNKDQLTGYTYYFDNYNELKKYIK